MSIKTKLQGLITEANTTTGESDTNLTDAVASLIDGYGGVTPTGTINITDTSLTDVANYANAQVVDADLVAGNIKKDVNILGVTGTFEGGGSHPTKGFVPTEWDADGYVTKGVWHGSTMPNYAFAMSDTTYKHSCSYKLSEITANDVTKINAYTFYKCEDLTSIHWSDNVSEIGGYAFRNCTSLALTSLPAGMTLIDNEAFYGCTSLALTSLPAGVTTIGSYAFSNCTSLALTSLPAGVTTIGGWAFSACTGLTRIEFNSKPRSIHSRAFSDCTNLLDIYVPWADGEVASAPWGATNASIHYSWTPTE